ncbi:GntR family transcriptional regulator [Streptomyces longwoodensis]
MDAQRSGEGGGKEFQRVFSTLLTRIAEGRYPLRSYLPPQRELAAEFDVSRDTVQRVMRELVSEGWIESRQGSGSRVVKTQRIHSPRTGARQGTTLGPLLGAVFEQPHVTLDVYTLTSESLDAHIRLQVERIRAGEIAPARIALRMLLPDDTEPLPYPAVKGDPRDTRLLHRMRAITRRHTESLLQALADLRTEGLVPSVAVTFRRVRLTPTFKLYLLNGTEALFGPYEVVERRIRVQEEEVTALDVLGLGATLTHHVKDDEPDSSGTVFVESMQAWFDSVWNGLAT